MSETCNINGDESHTKFESKDLNETVHFLGKDVGFRIVELCWGVCALDSFSSRIGCSGGSCQYGNERPGYINDV
jgi:hypothetical protein